jgi:lysophospholipase L1-like esterase
MSGPSDRFGRLRGNGAGDASRGRMAHQDSGRAGGHDMAHRAKAGAGLSHGFGQAGAAGSAGFGADDAAETAKLNRRHQAIAKVNARAEERGGIRIGFGGPERVRGSRGGLPFGASHMKEIAAVLTMVVVAGVLSAGLPGASAAVPGASPSPIVIVADASPTDVVATEVPSEEPTPAESPTVQPTEVPSATTVATVAPTKAPTKPTTPKVYKFVALGDSLTAWPSGGAWPARLDAEDAHLTLLHNSGVPGDTTAMMLARFDRDVLAYKPSVLFIMGGTNDLGHNIPIATTVANLRAIIVKAKKAGIGVFMMRVPPTAWLGEKDAIDYLNEQIFQMAYSFKVITIDTHGPLSTSTGVIANKYTTDGVHFTALGAQTLANTVYYRIKGYGY